MCFSKISNITKVRLGNFTQKFNLFLNNRGVDIPTLERMFGDDSEFMINAWKSRLENEKKNKQTAVQVEHFLLKHGLPLRISKEEEAEWIQMISSSERSLPKFTQSVLSFVNIPSVLSKLKIENPEISLTCRSYFQNLKHLDPDLCSVLEKIEKL